MKILYILPLITLAWTAISFAGLPLWTIALRRNRRYHRANNWSDDFQFDVGQASSVDSAGHDNSHPRSRHAGAIHRVAL